MLPKNLTHWLCAFGSSVVLYKYHSYVGTVVYCEGISMEPTVNHGDYLVVERISVLSGRIKKGDVVVAGQPRKSHNCSHVLKRIKALGEEHVTFWDEGHWRMVTREIPADHIWLEGDNSVHSLDSRTYGPVPLSHLEYRVLFRLWPLHQFGRLEPPKAIEASHPSLSRRPADSCADVVCLDAPTE